MRQQHHTSSNRLNFEFPESAHKHLKIQAVRLGVSIRELATQAIIEKLEALELQMDAEDAEEALEKHIAHGGKTLSYEEMMKKAGWDEL